MKTTLGKVAKSLGVRLIKEVFEWDEWLSKSRVT